MSANSFKIKTLHDLKYSMNRDTTSKNMHFVEKKLNVNRISLTIVYQLTPV
jgi:hypothetical protein